MTYLEQPIRSLFTLAIIVFSTPLLASTEVFFSPASDTKGRLVTAIQSAKSSLDIASFQFTSVDIAEALLEAKGRGVNIRLVADEKESQAESSVVPHLEEEGLDVKYIKGRFGGKMHHSFAIFDSKAVFTGTYNLTEYSDKFNFENAIFTDQPQLLAKYQAKFNELYGEPLAPKLVPAKEATIAEKEPERFIGLSPSHLGKLLGKDSMLPESDKRILWSHCKNYYVRGEGEIVSSSIDPLKGPTAVIRDKLGTEIELLLYADEADKISKTSGGEVVSYTGRLLARPGASHNYFKLDRGILK
ncbi:MAG: phospholipase D-like domain-containing protein [Candidatus Brocadiales bacterium]